MIVFFVHRFNDIDHLTPVIYKIAQATEEEIVVLGINPFTEILDDFRLRFLKDEFDVNVEYLTLINNITISQKIIGFLTSKRYIGGSLRNNIAALFGAYASRKSHEKYSLLRITSHLLCGISRSLLARLSIYDQYLRGFHDLKWSDRLLKRLNPSVLVFDHAATSGKKGAIAQKAPISHVLTSARKFNIPTVSLPHGVPLFLRHPDAYDSRKRDYSTDKADYTVFVHHWWRDECVDFGLDLSKVSVLGIARYCSEWVKILHNIIPTNNTLDNKGNGKLKIVYMDTGPDNYQEKRQDAQDVIDKISELGFVCLVYKPHTRRNKLHLNLNARVENVESINSVNLIQWADVVIGMHSSIMIEALIQDKVYISPIYFRQHEMIYEKYGACWIVRSYEELNNALTKLNDNPKYRPYSEESTHNFLTDVVYAGENEKDVLGAYCELILNISN